MVIPPNRTQSVILWTAIAILALTSTLTALWWLVLLTWGLALAGLVLTATRARPRRDERLVRAPLYRVSAGALLATALAGCVLGLLPDASGKSEALAPFMFLVAIFAYRVLVARGSSAVMWLVTLAALSWVPFAIALALRSRCAAPHLPDWTERASRSLFQLVLILIPALVAVTMHAFEPRNDELPDARLR